MTKSIYAVAAERAVKSIILLVSQQRNLTFSRLLRFYRPNSFLIEVTPGEERQTLMTFIRAECVILTIDNKDDEQPVSLEINQIIREQPDATVFLLSNLEESLYWTMQQIRPEWRNRIQLFNTSKGIEDLLELTFQLP